MRTALFLAAWVFTAAAARADQACTARILEEAAASHLHRVVERLADFYRTNVGPLPHDYVDATGLALGAWAGALREAQALRSPADTGFEVGQDVHEATSDGDKAAVIPKQFDLAALVRDMEGVLTSEELQNKYLRSLSKTELMIVLTESVIALSPAAVRLVAAAGDGLCTQATDTVVDQLLVAHKESCSFSAGLRHAVNNAFLKGKIEYPDDFKRSCGPWCQHRLQTVLEPVLALHRTNKGDSLSVNSLNQIFNNFCGPVLDAILDSCGSRRGSTSESIAIVADFAVAGNVNLILKMRANLHGLDMYKKPLNL
jgi:hypothetical protein